MKMIWIFMAAVLLVVIVFAIAYYRKNEMEIDLPAEPPTELDATPDQPSPFGYKTAWLAVRTEDTRGLAEKLALTDQQAANWSTGVEASYNQSETHVFVSPSVHGWTFVVGAALPDVGDPKRPDKCTPLLQELSTLYGEACYFGTHRIVEFHAWILARNGQVIRKYAYLGEKGITLWDEGKQTEEEKALGFRFFADKPPPGQGDEYYARKDLRHPKEEDVTRLAGRWSIDPTTIDQLEAEKSVGIVGRVPRSWR
jgi:hypothetical protein